MKASRSLQLLLVLPTLLIVVVALAMLAGTVSSLDGQYRAASEEQSDDLAVIEEAARFGADIGHIQQRVAAALRGAKSGELDELQLYRMHTAIVDDLEDLHERVEWLATAGLVISANHDSARGLLQEFAAYRRFVLMSTDVIAVDPAVASAYIDEAVVHYRDFAIYANRITRLLAERSGLRNLEQRDAFDNVVGRVMLIGLPALVGIMLLVMLGARRASQGLLDIADAVGRLSIQENGKIPLPRIESMARRTSGEFRSIARTLLGFRDALERQRAAEEKAFQLTFYDPLTELPNRRLLGERLGHAHTACLRQGQYGAVLWVDLDDFKSVNDLLGHASGDQLLVEVALRMRRVVEDTDTVARLGGDEFAVLMESLGPDDTRAAQAVEALVGRIHDAFRAPVLLDGEPVHFTASIGVVLFNGTEGGETDYLRHAETAMYRAKEEGRDTFRFFNPGMQDQLERRIRLENEMRQAVDSGQLRLLYQLQVDEGDVPVGVEALLRWEHPERGLLSPLEFIPLAEETGLIVPMGQWVLESACERLREWGEAPATCDLTVAVNVSARQFMREDFVTRVCKEIERTGIEPGRLKLEVTESVVLESLEVAIEKMQALRAIGIHFSLDDFGTGYSSLQYLKRLPLDQLKIDRSFVSDITEDEDDATIVETIIAMGHAMGLDVIAEGVETRAQQQFLRQRGCRLYQGYLFSRPLAPEALAPLLAGRDR